MIVVSYNVRGLGRREKRKEVKELLRKVKADLCCLQETKLESVNKRIIKSICGNSSCEWEFAESEGNSGGLFSVWNPSIFQKVSSWHTKVLLVLNGYLIEDGKNCTIINVYSPNSPALRSELWDQLASMVDQLHDSYLCIIGDFNTIRSTQERRGLSDNGNRSDILNFNNFIDGCNLVDIKLLGRFFTLYRPNSTCKSRLDRMLVNEEWINKWPNTVLRGGRRTLSDHIPIYVESSGKD